MYFNTVEKRIKKICKINKYLFLNYKSINNFILILNTLHTGRILFPFRVLFYEYLDQFCIQQHYSLSKAICKHVLMPHGGLLPEFTFFIFKFLSTINLCMLKYCCFHPTCRST